MMGLLLFCAMLLQSAAPAAKPVLENDRIAVWDLPQSGALRPLDAVMVTLAGEAVFVPKGTAVKADGRSFLIELKEHAVPAVANNSGYPLAFPRPGARKLFENSRVIVWDYSWTPGVSTPVHFHDKDTVVVFLEDGDVKSTTLDGQAVVNEYTPGVVRFNQRNRIHFETLVRGKQRAIITELK
ncbi:MAG TPA: hypothetical protein VKT33_11745 [Candidatus Angelobacter sp.]|nr:hypothetical protein [Candidatus Angelobacter sp.]